MQDYYESDTSGGILYLDGAFTFADSFSNYSVNSCQQGTIVYCNGCNKVSFTNVISFSNNYANQGTILYGLSPNYLVEFNSTIVQYNYAY